MSYNKAKFRRSMLTNVELLEGEPIEHKIERIVSNKEPITDGAPDIFTERKDGVISAYNIRTDRWEIAQEGMSLVERNMQVKRDSKAGTSKTEEKKEVKTDKEVTKGKSIEGSTKAE